MQTVRSERVGKTSWGRGPFWLASIPLAVAVLCLVALGIQQTFTAFAVREELARVREAGYPTGDASMSHWYAERTSSEGTKAWSEILRLVGASSTRFGTLERLPYVGSASVPREIPAAGEWAEEADVGEYLRWMRPVLEQIHEATKYPTPVWQPIEFQGISTLLPDLQGARSIVRLLQLEAEYAIYQGDEERALRALDSMRGVAAAMNLPIFMIGDVVQIALRDAHQSMVRRLLSTGDWNEDQLHRLMAQLGPPRDIPQRWKDVVAGERAMWMASVAEPEWWEAYRDPEGPPVELFRYLFMLPSAREQLLKNYRAMETVGAGGIEDLTLRAGLLDDEWSRETSDSNSLFLLPSQLHGMYLPAIEAYATAVAREETSRRFALTALAIKEYELQTGDWPADLTQLERVGLQPSDWQTVSGGRFGYEIAEGEVYLWSYLPHEQQEVSATRPALLGKDGSANDIVATIR